MPPEPCFGVRAAGTSLPLGILARCWLLNNAGEDGVASFKIEWSREGVAYLLFNLALVPTEIRTKLVAKSGIASRITGTPIRPTCHTSCVSSRHKAAAADCMLGGRPASVHSILKIQRGSQPLCALSLRLRLGDPTQKQKPFGHASHKASHQSWPRRHRSREELCCEGKSHPAWRLCTGFKV